MDEETLNSKEWPDFIPGIYNYCDRWCERCEKQLQCISYMMGKKIEARTRLCRAANMETGERNLWIRLRNILESTNEVLQELAEERGMKVEEIYLNEQFDKQLLGEKSDSIEKDERLYRLIESCDILKVCKIYEYWGERCLNHFEAWMEQPDYEHADEVEVVTWYLDLIQTKMRKTLHSQTLFNMGQKVEVGEIEGSAKVALLSIDQSVVAWEKIRSFYPEYGQEIGHLLVILSQIQRDVEREFPTARQFVRPGFE